MPNKQRTTDYTSPIVHQDESRPDPQDRDTRVMAFADPEARVLYNNGTLVRFKDLPSDPIGARPLFDEGYLKAEEFQPEFDENGDPVPREKLFNTPGPNEKGLDGFRRAQGQGGPP